MTYPDGRGRLPAGDGCKGPDCSNEVVRSTATGRPADYCTTQCRVAAFRARNHHQLAVDVADLLPKVTEGARLRAMSTLSAPLLADLRESLVMEAQPSLLPVQGQSLQES